MVRERNVRRPFEELVTLLPSVSLDMKVRPILGDPSCSPLVQMLLCVRQRIWFLSTPVFACMTSTLESGLQI